MATFLWISEERVINVDQIEAVEFAYNPDGSVNSAKVFFETGTTDCADDRWLYFTKERAVKVLGYMQRKGI